MRDHPATEQSDPAGTGRPSRWYRLAQSRRPARMVLARLARLRRLVVARLAWWRRPRRLVLLAALVVTGAVGVLGGSMAWVRSVADSHLYAVADAPAREVALVLGAEVYSDGTPSPYLAGRLETARQLYAAGKVRAILVSGDNGQPEYNEVDPMRAWLIDRGVPAHKVIGDYAGFDTYSSCARATRIFGVRDAIVVSQTYHLPRAVALCREVGIDAVGVGDDSLRDSTAGIWYKLALRDDLACVKAAYQMIVQPDPRYLGRHETSVEDALRDS